MILSAIVGVLTITGYLPGEAKGQVPSATAPVRSILVFSKTTGFRHDSIPLGREAILQMGIDRGWTVAFTEDAHEFESKKLKSFDAIVFLSTTGKPLDAEEGKALQGFIHSGGGFVGVHAAADSLYDWPWYGQLVGAFFLQHPAQQDAVVNIEDTAHPSTSFLPNPWKRRDEWYDYKQSPRANVHVLASLDNSSYTGSKMGSDHPITWCHDFEGGRSWYTGMGHTQESWRDPMFLKMIAEGIEWSCEKSKRVGH
jgi:type 1 glutamine amidotransferase